jgi:hypothetical protein
MGRCTLIEGGPELRSFGRVQLSDLRFRLLGDFDIEIPKVFELFGRFDRSFMRISSQCYATRSVADMD